MNTLDDVRVELVRLAKRGQLRSAAAVYRDALSRSGPERSAAAHGLRRAARVTVGALAVAAVAAT